MYYNTKNQQITADCPVNGYLEDGTLVQGLNLADQATQRLCGVYAIKSDSPPQPPNTTEDELERTVVVENDGVTITRVWVENPVIVPNSVSARQIRLWLINHQISLQSIDQAINNIEDPILREVTKVEWEFAPYVERTHPMINALGAILGLTPEQIDQAFITASAL